MIGLISHFAVSPPPSGWLECGGQAISRIKYCDLFRVLGTKYGTGDGSTTFNIPDIRGRAIAGPATMGGSTENRLGDLMDIGDAGGAAEVTLSVVQIPEHTHSVSITATSIATTSGTVSAQGTDATIDDAVAPGTGPAGDNAAHPNIQPTIIIPLVIFTGIYD